jgi:uncharacterized protein (DUF4415 family)
MTANARASKPPSAEWVDPDDSPEWTEEMFARADLYVGETLIRRGRPKAASRKEAINIRLSPEVLARFKATGRGWQTRIDRALKDWLAAHPEVGADGESVG